MLEADSGALATRAHHTMTVGLAVATPLFFMVPDSWTDGSFNKTFGLLLSAGIAAHSWIGMNYVCTDYVPKVSRALLGPSRIFNVALTAITFLGLARINFSSKGGIKGCIKGLWNPGKK
jgi:succinate dehydrogenase hydrophobic anchor subunit